MIMRTFLSSQHSLDFQPNSFDLGEQTSLTVGRLRQCFTKFLQDLVFGFVKLDRRFVDFCYSLAK